MTYQCLSIEPLKGDELIAEITDDEVTDPKEKRDDNDDDKEDDKDDDLSDDEKDDEEDEDDDDLGYN